MQYVVVYITKSILDTPAKKSKSAFISIVMTLGSDPRILSSHNTFLNKETIILIGI